MTTEFTSPPAGWMKAIATVGLPSVLAMILTAFMIWTITDAHAAMAKQMVVVTADIADVRQGVRDNSIQLQGVATLIRLNRQICLNTAPDAQTRARCLEP